METDKELREILNILAGHASVCWDKNKVFDTSQALKACESAHDAILRLMEKREKVLNIQLDEHDKENADLKKKSSYQKTQMERWFEAWQGWQKKKSDLEKRIVDLEGKLNG